MPRKVDWNAIFALSPTAMASEITLVRMVATMAKPKVKP